VKPIEISIVSDIVCPWCVVGYRQLATAAADAAVEINVKWHPFELNPQMPSEGQNLTEHICEKYGTTPEQSEQNRERLTGIASELGFSFRFTENSRMVNTFNAHRLLHWAGLNNKEHELKTALFDANFTQQVDISDSTVLVDIAASIGLDKSAAKAVLDENQYEAEVREEQQLWVSRGITGVPAMVFDNQYLVTGAQGTDNYKEILTKLASEQPL